MMHRHPLHQSTARPQGCAVNSLCCHDAERSWLAVTRPLCSPSCPSAGGGGAGMDTGNGFPGECCSSSAVIPPKPYGHHGQDQPPLCWWHPGEVWAGDKWCQHCPGPWPGVGVLVLL